MKYKPGPTKRSAPTKARKITDSEEEEEEDEESFDFKFQWFWKSDNGWVAFDKPVNMKIEQAFHAGKKKVNVDSERFVDFKDETQRRIDDPSKRRPIKKEKWDPKKDKKRKVEPLSTTAAKTQTIIKKGRAQVLPLSGLQKSYHVLDEGKVIWTCTLNQTDINNNNNKFYKIQVLEKDVGTHYYCFSQWGRVGQTGQSKSESCATKQQAKAAFEKKFKEKTGNMWGNPAAFQKKSGKYDLIEEDFDDEEEEETQIVKVPTKIKLPDSVLDKQVHEFIKLIADVRAMTSQLIEMKIDVKKMPLGKLSKKQIKKGYGILKEIDDLLNSGKPSNTKIIDCTNRFYTLIPHAFGNQKLPIIDSKPRLQEKINLLDGLENMEIASKILKNPEHQLTNPVDDAYKNLKLEKLEPLDPQSSEWSSIELAVRNTHAPTHKQYKLKIADIFTVERPGEVDNFKPWSSNSNRMLLWHGSRITNWVGILSQGLRIAPPEAPVTGYMFGKGVYFADSSSKSANYCHANRQNPHGVLLLCEVALGNFYRKREAEMIAKLPSQYQSTFGEGKYTPDPQGNISINGAILPAGKIIDAGISDSSLLYNEFIVYDIAQIVIRYIVRIDFEF